MRSFYLAIALLWLSAATMAGQQASVDSLDSRVKGLEKQMAFLKNLKITGYIQAQWQVASAAGIKSFAGGDFPESAGNRFSIRRGRIKFSFSDPRFQLVYQPEITERGIALRDAYGVVTEPWLGQFSLTAGVFNRPFSFENIYSSSLRETPERARFSQTLLPNERETGAMLSWKWKGLRVDGGFFNGNSIAQDNDSRKDFIGRTAWAKTGGKVQYGMGVSYYRGTIRQGTNAVFVFEFHNNEHLYGMFMKDTLHSPSIGQYSRREYFGLDAQYSFRAGIGKTTLRAELIAGTQPGTQQSSESPRTRDGLPGNIYIRHVSGGAVCLVQTIGNSPFQAVVKYDWFDPNTSVSGSDIGQSGSNLGAADIRYDTWGAGVNLIWQNLTLMAYYDLVRNEKTPNLGALTQDLKDNVLTLRAQIKF